MIIMCVPLKDPCPEPKNIYQNVYQRTW
uniref:Uncharacterized protein n=1 Tax=Rhizophora mucronata TaxID=61149 RepID=A0A2P2N6A7_RHIMU